MVCLFSNRYNSFGKRIGVCRHWMYGGLGLTHRNCFVNIYKEKSNTCGKWTENKNEGHVIRVGQSISATWAMAQGPHLTKTPQEIKGIFVNYAFMK